MMAVFGASANLAATTRHARAMALKRVLRYLHEDCGSPRLAQFVPRVVRPLPRAITATAKERVALLDGASRSMRCWLLFCSDLAMRSGTAAIICPNHYDQGRRELSFKTKYGEQVTLPVTQEIWALLESVPEEADRSTPYVSLLNKKGGTTSAATLRRAFRNAAKAAGITRHITPHDLRRTTAVAVHRLTKDLTLVQALLGHRTLESTLYYLDHHNREVPRAMLEAAKLNRAEMGDLELAKLNPVSEVIQ